MPMKLLFITSHYFYQPTRDALTRLALPCETTVVPYNNFSHIAQVYGEFADRYDACFVSGVIAKQAIEIVHKHISRPLVPFQVSSDALHRNILQLAVETRNLDFSRIAMDFLLALGDNYSVSDFLKIEDLNETYKENAIETIRVGTDSSITIENVVLDKITALWDQKAIDLVICQYSSITPELEARGIPYRCPFLSDQHLADIIRETLTRIELQHLKENHPVIVQVFPQNCGAMTAGQKSNLATALESFTRQNLLECVIQSTDRSCVLITSLQILRFLTDEFQVCRLSDFLRQKIDFQVLIGYGVGTSVLHAMNNAQLASKEASLARKPFIVDSKGSLIGPLNSENCMTVSPNTLPDVSSIAKRCSLSALTVQKIITILNNSGTDKLTVPELASRLNTTVRNANRIMLNLCRGGAAVPVYNQVTHSRGRPIQVYQLDFSNM